MNIRHFLLSLGFAILFSASQTNAAMVYLNDFESAGSETNGLSVAGTLGSLSRISLPTDGLGLSSANQSMWLGKVGYNVGKTAATPETINLALSGLVPSTQYTVSFDLLAGGSWDGSAGGYGPDEWTFRVVSGSSNVKLVDATFSNCGVNNELCGASSPQTYSDSTPLAGTTGTTVRPESGADAYSDSSGNYSLDYGIYWFGHGVGNPQLQFIAGDSTATLIFQRISGSTDSADEYWALDNITVNGASAVPIPAAIWLFGSGLFCLFGFMRHGRKK